MKLSKFNVILRSMCGISGKVYFNKKIVTARDLRLMTRKIGHRGPDNWGNYISKDRHVGFGHNRLAIIDLSKNGNQPMIYQNRYVITANNEIYNFQSERTKLEKTGFRFNSKSDTEVILALYAKYKKTASNIYEVCLLLQFMTCTSKHYF